MELAECYDTVFSEVMRSILLRSLHRDGCYISRIDLETEEIDIKNLTRSPISMAGWTISDADHKHVYSFDIEYVLSAGTTATLFCCPGKFAPPSTHKDHLIWYLSDGVTPRSAQILNNDGETVSLVDKDGKLVSLRRQTPQGLITIGLANNFIKDFTSALLCFRVALVIAMGLWGPARPALFVCCGLINIFIEFFARELRLNIAAEKDSEVTYRALLGTCSRLQAVVTCIVVSVILYSQHEGNPLFSGSWGALSYTGAFILEMVALDMSHLLGKAHGSSPGSEPNTLAKLLARPSDAAVLLKVIGVGAALFPLQYLSIVREVEGCLSSTVGLYVSGTCFLLRAAICLLRLIET